MSDEQLKYVANLMSQTIDLERENEQLKEQLQQKENIKKEAMKYIKEHSTTIDFKTMRADCNLNMNELLEILGGRK